MLGVEVVAGGWGGGGGGEHICSLANYSVAYEETQSNQVSDFRDFVCVSKGNPFCLLLSVTIITHAKVFRSNCRGIKIL